MTRASQRLKQVVTHSRPGTWHSACRTASLRMPGLLSAPRERRESPETGSARLCFGLFEFDPRTGILRREGNRCDLRPQQARALALLLSHEGQVVSREELRECLWGSETFVDFEAGLNTCIRRLRSSLGEDAEEPRFIQTIPGQGYRFIAPVTREHCLEEPVAAAPSRAAAPRPDQAGRSAWRRLGRLKWAGLGIVVGVALLVTLLPRLESRSGSEAPPALSDSPLVLLGKFESASGEPLVDESIEEAFRVGLGQAAGLQIMAPAEVRATLVRMRLPPTTVVEREVGVEVCQRFGARALVLGGLHRIGNRFTLHAEVVEAETGRSVIARSSIAESEEDLLFALGDLVEQVRSEIGEYLAIETSAPRLADVTTSDLEALKSYSRAIQLDQYDPARLLLLERAVALDPEFAMAHSKLGVGHLKRGNTEAAIRHLRVAGEHAERLTDFERLYVEGHIALLELDGDGAVRAWSMMSEAYPNLAVGPANLSAALIYFRNDFDTCVEVLGKAPPPERPLAGTPVTVQNTIECLVGAGRLEEALELATRSEGLDARASELLTIEPLLALKRHAEVEERLARAIDESRVGSCTLGWEHLLASAHADQLRFEQAIAMARRTLEHGDEHGLAYRSASRVSVMAYLEAAGRGRELQAELELAVAELAAAADLRAGSPGPRAAPAVVLLGALAARNDNLDVAKDIRERVTAELAGKERLPPWRGYLSLLEGEILAAEGRPAEALARLRPVVEATLAYPLHSRASLARWYEATGQDEAALAEHRLLSERRGRALAECLSGVACSGDAALNLLAVGAAERRLATSAARP